ncbi:11744_t:CDS:2 [Paraglomus brasilianum]|uniref:11744_t:CDS:1 n=1 Tax=Paraglomus brasilianum TaxID=144538 RepID=A0A9N8W0S8_9GLOM|nr:11744_t:CDS:2 [Paraglomus brasilianum]
MANASRSPFARPARSAPSVVSAPFALFDNAMTVPCSKGCAP